MKSLIILVMISLFISCSNLRNENPIGEHFHYRKGDIVCVNGHKYRVMITYLWDYQWSYRLRGIENGKLIPEIYHEDVEQCLI